MLNNDKEQIYANEIIIQQNKGLKFIDAGIDKKDMIFAVYFLVHVLHKSRTLGPSPLNIPFVLEKIR